MSTNLSSAPLRSHMNRKSLAAKVKEYILTGFAITFMLMPVVVMASWFGQFIDLNGAGDLAQEVSNVVFGSKGQ